jgi:hypothetical protein
VAISVLHALARPARCTRAELAERLAGDGVTFNPDCLDDVLTRLWEVGHILLAQRSQGHPVFIVAREDHPFDDVDALAADICLTLKRRDEQFDDEDQLSSYLDEDGIAYTSESLAVALRQLEELGRIRRPVQEFGLPTPGIYVPPRIYNGP